MTPLLPVLDAYQATDLSAVKRSESNGIFAGKEVCIMVDDYAQFKTSKAELERAVHREHGKLVQNPMASTDFVIAASARKAKVCITHVGHVHDEPYAVQRYARRWRTLSHMALSTSSRRRGCSAVSVIRCCTMWNQGS